MPPKANTLLPPARLPPLKRLRVRRPDAVHESPCSAIMSVVLGCWASSRGAADACMGFEQQLRACMDGPRSKGKVRNTINYHLMRLYPKIKPPAKRKT